MLVAKLQGWNGETQSGVLEDVIATAAVSMPATHRSLIDQVALQRMPDGWTDAENLSQKPFVTHQNYLDGLFDQPTIA